jgi:hypothetical protein
MAQNNGEFSADGRKRSLTAAVVLFFTGSVHHPLPVQPCPSKHRIIGGVQTVVRLRFRVAVLNASAEIIVLRNLAPQLVQERTRILHARKENRPSLHAAEDGADTGGSVHGPHPKHAVLPRRLFTLRIEHGIKDRLLLKSID